MTDTLQQLEDDIRSHKQSGPQLNTEQQQAVAAMVEFLDDKEAQYFLLKGPAGTGKTFCIRALVDQARGRFIYTAPTNKATKVLRDTLADGTYRPETRTIFSLLGLKMEPDGEVKVLTAPEDPVDLNKFRAVVVDEAYMINKQLMKYIEAAASLIGGPKFIFMGDEAQLPPVGEPQGAVASIKRGFELTKVMRHDNQVLTFAQHIRAAVYKPFMKLKFESDNDGQSEGVWKMTGPQLAEAIGVHARCGLFQQSNGTRIVSWRNATVDTWNKQVRRHLFSDADAQMWLPTDRIIFTGPAKDLEDELIATTDDEGSILRVEEEFHAIYPSIKIHRLTIQLDTGAVVTGRVIHPDAARAYTIELDNLATTAKYDRRKWKDYYAFKEAFHQVRHSYALTSHRAQGSTYTTVIADWQDILANRNRSEAMRSLYVAVTRPKKQLII